MRFSDRLGLVAICHLVSLGLVACATTPSDSTAVDGTDPASAVNLPGPGDTSNPDTPSSPAGPNGADPADPEAPPAPLATGITITDVAMFQAVRVPVVDDGALVKPATRNAPVVANRPGLLRVYVKPDAGFRGTTVTAELRLVSKDQKFPVIRDTKAISAPSKEDDPQSTLNLDVPGDSLPEDVTFQVSLTTPDARLENVPGERQPARFPSDGSFDSMGAELSGKLRVVVVPVKYDGDGSGRIPIVSDAQLEAYRKNLMRFYPASEVEVTARAAYDWKDQIASNGNGFSSVLRAITQLRQDDKVDKDVYYYGLLTPKATMAAYCGGGCVTGLSAIVNDPSAAGMRASVGIGFEGLVSANTMAHELGHAHGRQHAPCGGPQGPDPKYPYSSGGIGVWGYDIFSKALISPSTGKDIMGYCQNQWVSDYTYSALFDRIAAIRQAASIAPPWAPTAASRYRVATADGDGKLVWDGELDLDDDQLTGAEIKTAKFLAASGDVVLNRPARFYPFDHLPGGFVFLPKEAAIENATWSAVTVEGFAGPLAR